MLSNDELYKIKYARWKSRTDLKFLCNKVLGYKDVCEVHDPLLNLLQKFPEPSKEQFIKNDDISTGFIKYTPVIPLDTFVKQEKIKRRLILDFRGSLKTTINAAAHTLQCILNYPNTSVLIVQSNAEKAEEILAEIKNHFCFNKVFRDLFPEHVPQKKPHDWGTKGAMTTEAMDYNNLALGQPHKEGTIITGGIDKGLAGKHVDFIKFSDIVDPNNSKTENSCHEIAKQYYLCENLLTSPIYWIDVEGTRYSFQDLYGKVIKSEAKLDPERRVWSIYVRGCYKKKTKDDQPQKFTPEELLLDDLAIESEKSAKNPLGKVSWWPERYPAEVLEHKRAVSPYEFATQMYNSPQSAEEGMIPFPVKEGKWPVMIKRDVFNKEIPKSYYEFSIDTAETDNQKSNYSSIAIACWSGSGNCYIVDVIYGKFLPDKLIDHIYAQYLKYNPRNIKIEETSFVRGFMSGLRREGEKYNIYLPIELIKRENNLAKKERILSTLQPYYLSGQLRFLDDISCLSDIIEQFREHPTGQDDILDSIADLFQNKEYFGNLPVEDKILSKKDRDIKMTMEYKRLLPKMTEAYLGLGDYDKPNSLYHQSYNRTGGL